VLQAEEPFLFARFENAPSESEEAVESRVEVLPGGSQQPEMSIPSHPPPAAFDNPMYGNTKVRKPNIIYKLYSIKSTMFRDVGRISPAARTCPCRLFLAGFMLGLHFDVNGKGIVGPANQ
jgi:hypothetical protein